MGDNESRRQVSLDVDSGVLQPYKINTPRAEAVYIEALTALTTMETLAPEMPNGGSRPSLVPADLARAESGNVSNMHCPRGHELVPSSRGKVFSRRCDRCSRQFRRERHMKCRGCQYTVCHTCWEQAFSAHRGAVHVALGAKCPRGHLLERLEGTAVRGSASCKKCFMRDLGVVCPFFL